MSALGQTECSIQLENLESGDLYYFTPQIILEDALPGLASLSI